MVLTEGRAPADTENNTDRRRGRGEEEEEECDEEERKDRGVEVSRRRWMRRRWNKGMKEKVITGKIGGNNKHTTRHIQ